MILYQLRTLEPWFVSYTCKRRAGAVGAETGGGSRWVGGSRCLMDWGRVIRRKQKRTHEENRKEGKKKRLNLKLPTH